MSHDAAVMEGEECCAACCRLHTVHLLGSDFIWQIPHEQHPVDFRREPDLCQALSYTQCHSALLRPLTDEMFCFSVTHSDDRFMHTCVRVRIIERPAATAGGGRNWTPEGVKQPCQQRAVRDGDMRTSALSAYKTAGGCNADSRRARRGAEQEASKRMLPVNAPVRQRCEPLCKRLKTRAVRCPRRRRCTNRYHRTGTTYQPTGGVRWRAGVLHQRVQTSLPVRCVHLRGTELTP